MHLTTLLLVAALAVTANAMPYLRANVSDYTPEALKDEVHNLPGIPSDVNFRIFAGYIPINEAQTRRIFYIFVESQNNPKTDPVMLWTNGGPGCSGLLGFFTEQGPFRPLADGNLKHNRFAWNKIANMVFIEQPGGVGYSQVEGRIPFSDSLTAEDNRKFVVQWFNRFSNYRPNEFFLTSESYGGHYLPLLAKELISHSVSVNFKGFAVGNPLTYMPYRDYAQYAAMNDHQIIPRPEWDEYISTGCAPNATAPTPNPPLPRPIACASIEGQWDRLLNGMDPYALDFPVCKSTNAAGRQERYHFIRSMHRAKLAVLGKPLQGSGDYFPDYEPCEEDYTTKYLNRRDVADALHAVIPAGRGWSGCTNINFQYKDEYDEMMSVYKWLLNSQSYIKMLIYSGDDDAICGSVQEQIWLWEMGLPIMQKWHAWTTDGQVSGFHVAFSGLHFATVRGAGHMVPQTRPAQSLQAMKNFLSDRWN